MHEGPLLHVAFSHSAAHSLRLTLKSLGRDEHVAMYPDDLGYGPINPPSVEARAEFWAEVMLFEDNPKIGEQTDAFWADVASDTSNQVAWFSRRCVSEYAAFHEYVSQRDSPPLMVDVADVPFVGPDGVPSPFSSQSFSYISTEAFVRAKLLSRVTRASPAAYADARQRWARLKSEGASLRVLDASGLESAAITYFDDVIISCATRDWQKCARVVGDAVYLTGSGEFRQTADSFIWFRLRHLMHDGVLDSQGDTSSMRDSFVRARR